MISRSKQTRKWHRHHKLSRKKILWVAGLRKGRAKEFGRTTARVRGRKKKGSATLSSRARKSLSLSKTYRAGQEKDSKRLGTLSARDIAKKLYEYVKLEYERLTSLLHLGRLQSSDANTKASVSWLILLFFSCHGHVIFIIPFFWP